MDNLNKMDVIKLKPSELTETDGGVIGAIAAGIAAGVVISALNNWSDIKSGVADAVEDGTAMYK